LRPSPTLLVAASLLALLLASAPLALAQSSGETEGLQAMMPEEQDPAPWKTSADELEQKGYPTVAAAVRQPGTVQPLPEGSDELQRFQADLQAFGARNVEVDGTQYLIQRTTESITPGTQDAPPQGQDDTGTDPAQQTGATGAPGTTGDRNTPGPALLLTALALGAGVVLRRRA
jgi:hypothetical protein